MHDDTEELRRLVAAVGRRYFAQNGREPPSEAQLANFATRLAALIAERGLPRPLATGEAGTPGEMTEGEVSPLVARVLAQPADPLWAEAARQLVKACFYPEFRICRDSFQAATSEGTCRRQELARVRKRVSGTHCVDCPHWVAFAPEAHAQFLREHWRGDAAELGANRDVFLPEDFRALRQWLHAKARERAH